MLGAVLPAAANGHAPPPPRRRRGRRSASATTARCASLIELLARERPVALLLDDLHWADDASIEFVQHLLRRPPRSPHLLVLALRRAERADGDAPRPRRGTEYVFLEPLDHDESLALLARRPGPERARADRARGARQPALPRPAHALRRLTDETLPPCVLAAVGRELVALPPEARALLDGAAVAGDPFDPELAAIAARRCLRGRRRPLDELVAAGARARHRHAAAASRSATRSCGAPSTTPRRPPGGSARTSGSPTALAERGTAARACARTTSRRSRGAGDEAAIALLTEAAAAAGGDRAGHVRALVRRGACGWSPTPTPRRRLELRAAERAGARGRRPAPGRPRVLDRGARRAAAAADAAAARARRRLRGDGGADGPRPPTPAAGC